MATDGDTAQVGPMLAEVLDIPHVTDVAEIVEAGEHSVVVRKLSRRRIPGAFRCRCPHF